jgi:hypothetical protein
MSATFPTKFSLPPLPWLFVVVEVGGIAVFEVLLAVVTGLQSKDNKTIAVGWAPFLLFAVKEVVFLA